MIAVKLLSPCNAAITLILISLSPMSAGAQPIILAQGNDESKVAVVKWAAMGSGCRAAKEQPLKDREVSLRMTPGNVAGKSPLLFELGMSHFNLKSGKRIERANAAEFYSECALRFAIRGQTGMRVKRINSLVKMDVYKEKGSSLLLFNELKFGRFGGDEKRMEYDEHVEIKGRIIDVHLTKDLPSIRSDGFSSCGTDQVLFYDFTLFAKAADRASQASISLVPNQMATIRLDFENC